MTNPQNEQMPDNPGAPEATDPEYAVSYTHLRAHETTE